MYQERDRKWAKILYNKYLNPTNPLSLLRTRNPPKGTQAWNLMKKYHSMIRKYDTWDLGRGDEALI